MAFIHCLDNKNLCLVEVIVKIINIFEDKLREFSSIVDDFVMNCGCILGIVFVSIIAILIILLVK